MIHSVTKGHAGMPRMPLLVTLWTFIDANYHRQRDLPTLLLRRPTGQLVMQNKHRQSPLAMQNSDTPRLPGTPFGDAMEYLSMLNWRRQ